MEDMWRPLIVAALEFGTTDSGYAFLFRHDFEREPLKIHFHNWHTGTSLSVKTPTCILLNKTKQFEAFGYDAESQHAYLVMDEKQDDYYFFDRFTMSLYNNENVTRDMVLQDKSGKQCSAVEVFTLSIKACVDSLMEKLERIDANDDDIIWVLTVPAPLTDSAKQLMTESAEKAGLHPKKLLLVTETEAFFTYCHYTHTTRPQGYKPGIMIKDPGTKSMVVDLRDKAAYITVLQQTYNGQLKVLCRATGGDCGGTSFDDRFCNILEEIVGGKCDSRIKKTISRRVDRSDSRS